MQLDRAEQICAAIMNAGLVHLGLTDGPPDWLKGVSLDEMMLAKTTLANHPGTRNADGSTSYYMHPDDRLVAATYTLLHYDSMRQAIVHDGARKGLVVVDIPTSEEDEA